MSSRKPVEQASFVSIYMVLNCKFPVSIKHGPWTADDRLGIKHELRCIKRQISITNWVLNMDSSKTWTDCGLNVGY